MINWKTKTLLVKPEQTYGEDSGPTAAANAILALNVRLAPMEGHSERGRTRMTVRAGDGSDRILGVFDESRRSNSGSPWITMAWRSTGVEPFYLSIEPIDTDAPVEIVQIYQVRVN